MGSIREIYGRLNSSNSPERALPTCSKTGYYGSQGKESTES